MKKVYLTENSVITLLEDIVNTYHLNYGRQTLAEAKASVLKKWGNRFSKRLGVKFVKSADAAAEVTWFVAKCLVLVVLAFLLIISVKSCITDYSSSGVNLDTNGGNTNTTEELQPINF